MDYTTLAGGQINSSGDRLALFLKVFTGNVLATYETNCIFRSMITKQAITTGKSYQFIATGTTSAQYHATPGAQTDGQTANTNERIITLDRPLYSSVFVDKWEELISQYDMRGRYARELAIALATKDDALVARQIVRAARASATVPGGNGGTQLTLANTDTDAAVLRAQIAKAAQTLDEKDVPEHDRHVALRPAQYHLLVNASVSTSILNQDISGAGSLATGKLAGFDGLMFHKTNQLPKTNVASGETGQNNTYTGNFTKTVAAVWTPDAVGRVERWGINVNVIEKPENLGTQLLASVAFGADILRPDCAVELLTV